MKTSENNAEWRMTQGGIGKGDGFGGTTCKQWDGGIQAQTALRGRPWGTRLAQTVEGFMAVIFSRTWVKKQTERSLKGQKKNQILELSPHDADDVVHRKKYSLGKFLSLSWTLYSLTNATAVRIQYLNALFFFLKKNFNISHLQ